MNGISTFLLGLVAASKAALFTEATTTTSTSTTTNNAGDAGGKAGDDGFGPVIMGATILGSSLFVLA
ncbi:hypothetical protein BgAZ_200010 [Babesia gibsoni]|uniref:Uncharacterized protein n=1 Tax=Babesia gibsoni TaxID=33632 RepID=A0AAD8LSL5_BABGI|nr:hypothetical protein BgAZ_200010 [Babesia gibsoni]